MRVKFNSHMGSSTVAALFLKSLHHPKVPTVGWGYFRKRCQGRRLLVGKVQSSESQASHKRGWRRGGGSDRECMGERRQTGGLKTQNVGDVGKVTRAPLWQVFQSKASSQCCHQFLRGAHFQMGWGDKPLTKSPALQILPHPGKAPQHLDLFDSQIKLKLQSFFLKQQLHHAAVCAFVLCRHH